MHVSNPRRELFAQELAKGKTADEAYVEAGYKADRAHASRLAANGSISMRVFELQQRAAKRVELTIEKLTELYFEDRKLARELGQAAAARSALDSIAKLKGFTTERPETRNVV